MAADQMFNAKWLEKEGVGLLIKGTGNIPERNVPAEEIVHVIKELLDNAGAVDGGSTYAEAAEKWEERIKHALQPGGSSFEELMSLSLAL